MTSYHNSVHFFADMIFGGPIINIAEASTGEVHTLDRPTAFDVIAEKFHNGEEIMLFAERR